MKWEDGRRSENVEDRRGSSGGRPGGIRIGGGGVGIGTIVIALIAGWIFGINPLTLIGMFGGGGAPVAIEQPAAQAPASNRPDPQYDFVRVVLGDTEDVWTALFKTSGQSYRPPTLVVFRGYVQTACGTGQSAMGPFYCPSDQKVYIDLGFYDTLRQRLGAPGDFAQAYVIAHEVGHHVQNLLGISDKVDAMRGRVSETEFNQVSVRLELQADCFAGIWANHAQRARQILDQGDIEEALNAAAQIGDDTIQRRQQGTVVPESFTHGSSQQRVSWFKRGFETGNVQQCNTFEGRI